MYKRPLHTILLVLLSALSGCALTGSPMAAQQAAQQQQSLLIGPGDLLHIQVYDTPELEQHARVDDAGNAPLLFSGAVSVAGKTPAEAADAIAVTMVTQKLLLHPQVSVTVEQYATQDVSVLGEVNKPGNYPLATPRPILEVISQAGGLDEFADRHILIRHHASHAEETYHLPVDTNRGTAADVIVYPGDTILVSRTHFVYVLGDVARPGGYPLSLGDGSLTLLQTLAQAGSANRTAVLSSARLIRKNGTGTQETQFDIAAIERGKRPDFAVAPDDVIFIPFSYGKNFVITGTSVAAAVGSAALYAH